MTQSSTYAHKRDNELEQLVKKAVASLQEEGGLPFQELSVNGVLSQLKDLRKNQQPTFFSMKKRGILFFCESVIAILASDLVNGAYLHTFIYVSNNAKEQKEVLAVYDLIFSAFNTTKQGKKAELLPPFFRRPDKDYFCLRRYRAAGGKKHLELSDLVIEKTDVFVPSKANGVQKSLVNKKKCTYKTCGLWEQCGFMVSEKLLNDGKIVFQLYVQYAFEKAKINKRIPLNSIIYGYIPPPPKAISKRMEEPLFLYNNDIPLVLHKISKVKRIEVVHAAKIKKYSEILTAHTKKLFLELSSRKYGQKEGNRKFRRLRKYIKLIRGLCDESGILTRGEIRRSLNDIDLFLRTCLGHRHEYQYVFKNGKEYLVIDGNIKTKENL